MNNLDAKIEAILFWKGEPMTIKKIAEITGAGSDEVLKAVDELSKKLEGRGVVIQKLGDEISLGTSPQFSKLIEDLTKGELLRDLGKAGLETLSIIVYKNGVTRAEIDYIRGVNSQFILRNLLMRGLIERIPNPNDSRSFIYKPTFALLGHLGITEIEKMPDYQRFKRELEILEAGEETQSGENNNQEQ